MKFTDNHSFEVILRNVGEKFFNTIAKNFVNDINSITHTQKKRGSKTKLSSANSKIRNKHEHFIYRNIFYGLNLCLDLFNNVILYRKEDFHDFYFLLHYSISA